jgi:hypothetical protein
MQLYEIFKGDVPKPRYQTQGPATMGQFTLNDVNYVIQFIKVKRGDMIHGELNAAPLTDNTYFFSFAAMGPNGQPNDDRIPARSAVKVFSTIMQALVEFVHKHGVDTLYFGCEQSDADKRALYERITKKYLTDYPWHLVGEEAATFFGSTKHLWYCAKN